MRVLCRDCIHWQEILQKDPDIFPEKGFCRRSAPIFTKKFGATWPITSHGDWCSKAVSWEMA
jgi:hypothetical protein